MIIKRNFLHLFGIGAFLLANTAYAANPNQANIPVSATTKQSANSVKSASNSNFIKANYKENEIIVKYKKNVSLTQVASIMGNNANINIATTFKALSAVTGNIYTVIKSKTLTTEELLEQLKADPNVEYAEPNYIYYPNATPNDPKFNKLWAQNNTGQEVNGVSGTSDADIDALEAWDENNGSSDVVIAVIDTGVDYKHEDLASNMWTNSGEIPGNGIDDDNNGYIDDVYGINAVLDNGDPMDEVIDNGGHGTHIAGTIAAVGNNGKGVVGVSWHSKIMALKFLSKNGGDTVNAIECLNYVLEQKNAGVNIVATNNSWGGGNFSQALKDAIAVNNAAGILFVAAAGNGGDDGIGDNNDNTPHYPSSYDLSGIISVAATDQNDRLTDFSNYGVKSVDLAAPGENILSTTPSTPNDIFYDDMEEDNMDTIWITGGINNTWGRTTNQEIFDNPHFPVPSSPHFLSDSPDGNYTNNTDSWIKLKNNIDLSSYNNKNIYIGFGAAIYMEDDESGDIYDHATIEVSGDGGSTWRTLFDLAVYVKYWQNPYILKIPNDLKTANFNLRFHIKSDVSITAPGWLLDNIGIGTAENTEPNYMYKSGTSMAAPQVSGAVALRASVCDEESIENILNAVLDTVDVTGYLNDKVKTQGRLNINTLVKKVCTSKKQVIMAPIYYLLGL